MYVHVQGAAENCYTNMHIHTCHIVVIQPAWKVATFSCRAHIHRKSWVYMTRQSNTKCPQQHRLVSFQTLCVRLMCHVDLPFLVVLVANEKHHVVCCSCYCWYAYHGYTSCRCRIKGVPERDTSLTVMSEDNTFWFKKVNQTRKYCFKTHIHFLIVLNKNQAV